MADEGVIGARKRDHLEICLDGDRAASGRRNGLDRYVLVHDALPEVDFDAIDLSTEFLGHFLSAPLIISSMTGGTDQATSVNRTLARAAQRTGIAMGVGSQRAALEDEVVAQTYRIRDAAPDVLLFGNLGAVQLNRGYGLDECLAAVEMIEADGLFLHLNSLQEACQVEGERDFSGLRDRIASLCRHAPFPVLLKTVGNGISPRTARKLVDLPLAGLEVERGRGHELVEDRGPAGRGRRNAGPLRELGESRRRNRSERCGRSCPRSHSSPAEASVTASTWPGLWPWVPTRPVSRVPCSRPRTGARTPCSARSTGSPTSSGSAASTVAGRRCGRSAPTICGTVRWPGGTPDRSSGNSPGPSA